MKIPVYKPWLPAKSLRYAHDALDSGWISRGKYNELAEEKLRAQLGVKHIVLTNNGTSATHLVAKALRFRYPDVQAVLMPDNVYIAAWNSFVYDKDFTIVPIKANEHTWNLDHKTIDRIVRQYGTEKQAICAVHNVGNIVNVPELKAKFPGLIVVEDACEGFLGSYSGTPVGTASLAASISFFGNKTITCGEGGAFLTDDDELYEFADRVRGQGQSREERFVHNVLGYNYRMTNVQAAMLCGQLECLDEILPAKKRVFDFYTESLRSNDRITLQQTDPDTEPSYWMFGVRVTGSSYMKAASFFAEKGIEIRPMFCPIDRHSHLGFSCWNDEVASGLREQCIILPSHPGLSDGELERIVEALNEYVRSLR